MYCYLHRCKVAKLIVKSRPVRLTQEEFESVVVEKYGNQFSFRNTVFNGVTKPTILTCKEHGDIEVTPQYSFSYLNPCPNCLVDIRNTRYQQTKLEKAREVHGGRYDYHRVKYIGPKDKVEIICKEHGSFFQLLNIHVDYETHCPDCAKINRRKNNDHFIKKARLVHGDKYSYPKLKYEFIWNKVIITCNEHGDFEQRAGSHLDGSGCPRCFLENGNRLNKDKFVINARRIHGDRYDYSKSVYTTSRTALEIICKEHGSFFKNPLAHVTGKSGCPKCWESKGERAISVILDSLGVKYVREYKLDGYKYRYDFFLPEKNILIEFHGKQHYVPVERFGGMEALKQNKIRDKIKKSLASKYDYTLIEFNYRHLQSDKLESLLVKKLNQLKMVGMSTLNLSNCGKD